MSVSSQNLTHELVSDRDGVGKLIRIWRASGKGQFSDPACLEVAFQRTVRVSDNDSTNNLPPGMGSFPISKTSDCQEILPPSFAAKEGYLLPMYQREALWIQFQSWQPFAVRIYVGEVNVVSGEPSLKKDERGIYRDTRYEDKKNVQDYIVTPEQLWLDGIATTDGKVRQFVAMPLGSGYSIEAQVIGIDLIGGIQIEVTPMKILNPPVGEQLPSTVSKKPATVPHFCIFVRIFSGEYAPFSVSKLHTVWEVKLMLQDVVGMPPDMQRLVTRPGGVPMEDRKTLGAYDLKHESMVLLLGRLGGGGSIDMAISAGGLIKQSVKKDNYDPEIWDTENGTRFNVRILNSDDFKRVTGKEPPQTPITAKTYAEHGFPYFDIFDEKPSGIKGEFAGVESVAEKDSQGAPCPTKAKAVAETIHDTQNPVVTLDQKGKRVRSSPAEDLKEYPNKKFCKPST